MRLFLAPTISENLPITIVMTAPETMYAVITQDETDVETAKSCAIRGRAGDKEV